MIGAEWARQWRRPRTLIVLGAAALFPIVLTILLVATGSDRVERVGDIPLLLVPRQSGFSVPVIALSSTMRFFLPLAIAVFAGEAIAGEASAGSLRYGLARPVSRARYLVSKAVVAAAASAFALALLIVAALAAGTIAFGWHPFTAVNGESGGSAGTLTSFASWSSFGRLAISTAFVGAGMASIFAFALLLSTLTSRPFVAVAGGAGLSVLSRVLNGDYLPGVASVSRYMPNNDIDLWQHFFVRPAYTSGMTRFLLLQLAYVVVFVSLAGWRFMRADVLA